MFFRIKTGVKKQENLVFSKVDLDHFVNHQQAEHERNQSLIIIISEFFRMLSIFQMLNSGNAWFPGLRLRQLNAGVLSRT